MPYAALTMNIMRLFEMLGQRAMHKVSTEYTACSVSTRPVIFLLCKLPCSTCDGGDIQFINDD